MKIQLTERLQIFIGFENKNSILGLFDIRQFKIGYIWKTKKLMAWRKRIRDDKKRPVAMATVERIATNAEEFTERIRYLKDNS